MNITNQKLHQQISCWNNSNRNSLPLWFFLNDNNDVDVICPWTMHCVVYIYIQWNIGKGVISYFKVNGITEKKNSNFLKYEKIVIKWIIIGKATNKEKWMCLPFQFPTILMQ